MKKLILITSLLLAPSCVSHKMTVIRNDLAVDTYCPNKTEVITLLKKKNGTMLKKCGFWGLVGDTIRVKKGLIFENQEKSLKEDLKTKSKKAAKINNKGDVIDDFVNINNK